MGVGVGVRFIVGVGVGEPDITSIQNPKFGPTFAGDTEGVGKGEI